MLPSGWARVTSNGDLIQSIADAYQSTSSWSIFAYILLRTDANSQMPVQTQGTNAVAAEKITMLCECQDKKVTTWF